MYSVKYKNIKAFDLIRHDRYIFNEKYLLTKSIYGNTIVHYAMYKNNKNYDNNNKNNILLTPFLI